MINYSQREQIGLGPEVKKLQRHLNKNIINTPGKVNTYNDKITYAATVKLTEYRTPRTTL